MQAGELAAIATFTTRDATWQRKTGQHFHADPFLDLAEWTGLEPATPGVTGRYSNQLNYHSMMASALQRKRHRLGVP
jgi:hypothetical protein